MICNIEFLHEDPKEGVEYLNDLVQKAHTWTAPSAIERTNWS